MSRICSVIALGGVICATWVASACDSTSGWQAGAVSSTSEDSLKRFLQRYAAEHHSDEDRTSRYCSAFVDLNADGEREALVYLMGRWWCGSGGCPTLILASDGSTFRLVTRIFITRTPIRVFKESTNGWCNIGVWVQGGGIQPGYEAELRFDGKTYPSNPSTAPARRTHGKAAGEVLIEASKQAIPLYP